MFPYFCSANRSAASSALSNTNDVVWYIGTARAPVVGSGRAPAWMARVRAPQTWSSIDVTRAKVASSCGSAEALGPHPGGVVAEPDQQRGARLDERGRATDERVRGRARLLEQLAVDAPPGPRARERHDHPHARRLPL